MPNFGLRVHLELLKLHKIANPPKHLKYHVIKFYVLLIIVK
jgi:hypothetical protein